jgi:UrcA family protein
MFSYKYYLLAVLAGTLPIAASHAATDPPIVRVTYRDLNLATPEGVSTLYQRLQHGAARYCEPVKIGGQPLTEFNRCVKDAITTTVKKIDDTRLSAYHFSQGGKGASECSYCRACHV